MVTEKQREAAKRNIKKAQEARRSMTSRQNALDLEKGVFTWDDPYKIALSLKNSALASRRKGTAYQSAVSMLNFYINRAGKSLPETRKIVLEKAKRELRVIFGREEHHARS